MLVIEAAACSIAVALTAGQLHRLANGLTGRGRRNTVRPSTAAGEHVHLTGTPDALTVTHRESSLTIPAGPDAALGRALRELEHSREA